MNRPLRLLLVDDSADDAALLIHALRRQGFEITHTLVDNATTMRDALERESWDLITSDHALPAFDAHSALALSRELAPHTPFVIVSGEIDLDLAVELMRAGARDYVRKSELARIGAVAERELREAELARARRNAETSSRESEEIFRAIVENVGDLVAVLDTNGRRLYNNPSYGPLFRPEDIVTGSISFQEIHPEDRDRIRSVFRRTVATGVGERSEFRFVLKDGSIRHIESEGRAIHDASGRVSKVVVVSRDITERKRLENELLEMATTDFLTGLPNRRQFRARLEEEIARMQRTESQRAAMLMLDLDHFKRVNDAHGHAAGDRVLKHFANVVRGELRKVDTAGRIGGEEFAVLLPGATLASAEVLAKRICRKLAATPLHLDGKNIPVTVSIGVSAMDADDANADAPFARADRALYRAKESGRNRVEICTENRVGTGNRPDRPPAASEPAALSKRA